MLVRVLHAELFGEGGPGQFDKTPPGGYPVGDVARAVVLVRNNSSQRELVSQRPFQIIQAIEEWSNGNPRYIARHLDLRADQYFRNLQETAEKILQDAKGKWPEEWYRFCERVHTCHSQTCRRDWGMRGLPISRLNDQVE